jgi:uncharacterized membrane protein
MDNSSSNSEDYCGNSTLLNEYLDSYYAARFIPGQVAFLILSFIICILCVVVWMVYRERYERTRLRSSVILVVSCLGMLANALSYFLPGIIQGRIACGFTFFLEIFVVPLICGAIQARLITFYLLSKFSKQAAYSALESLSSTGFAYEGVLAAEESDAASSGIYRHSSTVLTANTSAFDRLYEIWIGMKSIFFIPSNDQSEKDRIRLLRALRFMTSGWGVATTSFSILIPFFVVAMVVLGSNHQVASCYGCEAIQSTTEVTVFTVGGISIIFMLTMLLKTIHLEDPWGLRKESVHTVIFAILAFVAALCEYYVELPEDSMFQFAYVLQITLWLIVMESSIVQILLAYKEARKGSHLAAVNAKHHRNAESSGGNPTIGLDDLLADKTMAEAFEKHLVNELGIESLLFIRDAENWKSTFFDISPGARRIRARKIYSTYISPSGLYTVNIPETMVIDIRKQIMSTRKTAVNATAVEEDSLQPTLFDSAIRELRNLLTNGAVSRFMKSSQFSKITRAHSISVRSDKQQVNHAC